MLNQNPVLKVFLLFILTISIFANLNGQNCINYPDIEGAPCKDCAPDGWTPDNMFLIYVHIIPPVQGPLPETNCTSLSEFSGPSPSGGNVVVLFGDDGNEDITSIETTINGLDTDLTYVFGMYWEGIMADCAINDYFGGILRIYIEGQLYEFEGATDWELAEVCFTPTSSSVDILITTYEPGSHSSIIVDGNFDCSIAAQCCTIKPNIEEVNYAVCPEETLILEAGYVDQIGSVQIEWTCDPPEGLNYLSATNVISPEFTFPAPSEDFTGETFKFSLSVEDDVCIQTIECIEVEVIPSVAPIFDFELCDLDFTAVLPEESDNGYTGSWDGDTNIEFAGGTYIPFTFTLDAGQNNCLESYEYEVFVKAGYIPNFNFEQTYCLSDDSYYVLPAVSIEFVEGDWFPINEFNPSELGEGSFTFVFEPDNNFCASPFELILEILPDNTVSFDLTEQFCTESSFFVLPQMSSEGVSGTWTMDSIDLSIPIQGDVLVFTPNGSNNCSGEFNYEYSVNQNITPSFNLPQSICREDIVMSFDSITTQNIVGSWTPNEFNPDTASAFITAIWMPENQDSCILSLEVSIPIIDKETINLNLPDTLCAGDSTYILPDIDSIEGSWNLSIIDLANSIDSAIIVVYSVAENQCYFDFSDTIYVEGLDVPQFSISETYCSNEADINLPETSDNSIQGTWNINPVDPSLQDLLVIVFTPNSEECSEVFTQTLYFSSLLNPVFDIPLTICKDEVPFTFPDLSENGINGTWVEDTLDPSMIDQSTFSNTFTPDDTDCNANLTVTITILSFENVSLEITDPTGCETEDGAIQIIGTSTDMQLSTNNGMTWSVVMDLENLPSGSYSVQLRYEALPDCIVSYSPQLNNSEAPSIQELNTTDVSACDEENGSIECIAEGDDLEYSIDNVVWQTSNVFENLAEGNYVIYVRKASEIDCVSSASTEVESPDDIEICDGIDNNCNGEIDEDLPTASYYADNDMDDFGDPNDLIIDCIQPQGYILDNTDCDDNNADIYPGATEIANNGIDEDCDGIDLITSIYELAGQKIDIYPNPTNGLVIVEMEESKNITISLYDIHGKCLIHQRQVNNLDLIEYANGIYLIKITNHISFESIVERIVLNK